MRSPSLVVVLVLALLASVLAVQDSVVAEESDFGDERDAARGGESDSVWSRSC